MNTATATNSTTASHQGRLRSDLGSVVVGHGSRRARIIIDDLSGRFFRVPESLWQRLQREKATSSSGEQDSHDRLAWQQARDAGWTRHRGTTHRERFSPLFIRIPLVSIDGVAALLARRSDWVFSRGALGFWTVVIALATTFALSRYQDVAVSISKLPVFLSQANMVLLAGIFLLTKLVHEIAHAVACRRAGFRCGKVGVLLLFGIPCPFCDVTQVWRSPHASTRAGVMMAGMYAEAILASLATWVWATSGDETLRLHSMNVMIICSVSTLFFNANPLMRYDGYYVLSDWLGNVNLRSEARRAFHQCFPSVSLLGSQSRRTIGLALYHVGQSIYRVMMLSMVAGTVLVFAEASGVRLAALLVLLAMMIAMAAKTFSSLIASTATDAVAVASSRRQSTATGTNQHRGSGRKRLMMGGFSSLAAVILFMAPFPRQTTVLGVMEAVDAHEVYLATNGVIQEIALEIGDHVRQGEELVRVVDHQNEIEVARLQGQLRVASLRTRKVRRESIEKSTTSSHLETMQAVEESLSANLVSVKKKSELQIVHAPVSGILLPPGSSSSGKPRQLSLRTGGESVKGMPWCRIASAQRLGVTLQIDAAHRRILKPGMSVRVAEIQFAQNVRLYEVVSISSISPLSPTSGEAMAPATFDVSCKRITEEDAVAESDHDFLSRLGGPCRAVIDLPARRLFDDLVGILRDLFS